MTEILIRDTLEYMKENLVTGLGLERYTSQSELSGVLRADLDEGGGLFAIVDVTEATFLQINWEPDLDSKLTVSFVSLSYQGQFHVVFSTETKLQWSSKEGYHSKDWQASKAFALSQVCQALETHFWELKSEDFHGKSRQFANLAIAAGAVSRDLGRSEEKLQPSFAASPISVLIVFGAALALLMLLNQLL